MHFPDWSTNLYQPRLLCSFRVDWFLSNDVYERRALRVKLSAMVKYLSRCGNFAKGAAKQVIGQDENALYFSFSALHLRG